MFQVLHLLCHERMLFAKCILITCYLRLIEIDDFIADLWRVHLKVKHEGYAHVRRQ